MDLKQIEDMIDEHVEMITIDARGLAEARERAGKFLRASAILTTYLKALEEQSAKVSTLVEANYATAVSSADGKNITEKKTNAALNKSYTSSKEIEGRVNAQRNWLRGFIKIFENAHLMYRQYSREN